MYFHWFMFLYNYQGQSATQFPTPAPAQLSQQLLSVGLQNEHAFAALVQRATQALVAAR
jgi:hypothetical protein